MKLLALSDLISAGVGAAHAYVHGQSGIEKVALKNAVSSIAGRVASYYLSNGMFDRFTLGIFPAAGKNYLTVFVSRWLIGMALKEKLLLQKAVDTTLTDAFANEVLLMYSADKVIIPGIPSLGGP